MEEGRNRSYWLIAIFSFVAISGAAIQARGALVPTFETYFVVSKSELGLVTPVGTVGFVAAMLWIGPASGRLDLRRYLLFGLALTGVTLLLMGSAPPYYVLLVLIGVRSFGTGVFRALDRPTLSHLFPQSRARIFTLQEMAWAIGATIGPLVVAVVLQLFPWQVTYFVLAALCVPVFVLIWRLDPPGGSTNEDAFGIGDVRSVLIQPSVYGMMIALVVVGGIESGFFTWLATYAQEEPSIGPQLSSITLSIYLAAYVPGRLTFSRLAGRYRFTHLVGAVSILLTGLLYVAFVHAGGYALLGLIFAIGFFVSGLFPTLISMGIEANPAFTGPVNAVANVSAQAGFFTVPAVIGVLADRTTIQTAMLLQIGLAALLALIVLWLRLGPLDTIAAEGGAA